MPNRPDNSYAHYHAHIYFGPGTVEQARSLGEGAVHRFGVLMGRVHEREVGPHPRWSCQLTFDSEQFGGLMPWLDEHRNGLDVFVHPLTGDELADHTRHATWLGDESVLKVEIFRRR